mgnify:CR=1 FL=1
MARIKNVPGKFPRASRERFCSSVYDVDRHLYAGALSIGPDDRADLLGNTTLTANDLAHIVRCDAQLQRKLVRALLLRDGDVIGMLNKAAGDVEQQVFHFLHPVLLQRVDFLQQRTDRVGGLSAGLDPLAGAVSVDLDLSRGDAGVISADLLDEAAVAGEAAVSNNIADQNYF